MRKEEITPVKPCDGCMTKIDQAVIYDEVTCYETCEKLKEWQCKRNIENEKNT